MEWEKIFVEPAKVVILQLIRLAFKVVGVIIILILGWLVSNLLKTVVIRILKTLRLDLLSERSGLGSVLQKGGIKYTLSEVIGEISYWFGILVTFVVATNAMGLVVVADLLNRLIIYIPNIVVVIFILLLGILVSTLLGNMTKTAASNAKLAYSNLLGNIVRFIIIIFTIILSLEQLNISSRILELTVGVILFTIGLAIAIAFGLGCKDLAGDFLRDWIKKFKK